MKVGVLESTYEERLEERFNELKTLLAEWSRETRAIAKHFTKTEDPENAKLNLKLVRTIVSKWSIEILTLLVTQNPLGFVELRKSLKGISSRVLSGKLKMLENAGLIERKVLNLRPPAVRYTLTENGLSLTKLGGPVMFYLRFKAGLYTPSPTVSRNRREAE